MVKISELVLAKAAMSAFLVPFVIWSSRNDVANTRKHRSLPMILCGFDGDQTRSICAFFVPKVVGTV
jgi:hypothetical protein